MRVCLRVMRGVWLRRYEGTNVLTRNAISIHELMPNSDLTSNGDRKATFKVSFHS